MRGKFIGFIIKMVSVLRGFFYLNELKNKLFDVRDAEMFPFDAVDYCNKRKK